MRKGEGTLARALTREREDRRTAQLTVSVSMTLFEFESSTRRVSPPLRARKRSLSPAVTSDELAIGLALDRHETFSATLFNDLVREEEQ